MSGFKGLAKGGWHPKGKDGGKESWRGDFKGINTVAGWMGKGKDTTSQAHEHMSAPLSSLRDPSEFEPPPKRVPGVSGPPKTGASSVGGLGAALPQEEVRAQAQRSRYAQQKAEDEAEEEKAPPGPFKMDTTGLSTTGLPPPPKFRGDGASQAESEAPKPKPKLPPRLPPREAASPIPASPPTTYDNALPAPFSPPSQGAVDGLSRTGVSASGVAKPTSPTVPSQRYSTSPTRPVAPSSPQQQSQLSELQARFGKMRTASSETAGTTSSSGGGTTWAQKRAALETASSFKKDPPSVSLSEARNAASTANKFRERHGEQIAAGWKAASGLSQKYGMPDKANGYSGSSATPGDKAEDTPSSPKAAAAHKKPPPPPPPKKHELSSNPPAPPPLPIGSKPRPT